MVRKMTPEKGFNRIVLILKVVYLDFFVSPVFSHQGHSRSSTILDFFYFRL